MNPIRTLKILRRAQKLFGLLEEASVSKSLFKSKIFWFNILSATAELSQVLPIPAGTLILVTNLINIGLRIVTAGPVHVLPK